MTDSMYWRQQDIFVPQDQKITVIGAGGIGSWVVLGLVKTGFKNIEVWDGDVVEEHNIPNQLFSAKHCGQNKAQILHYYFPVVATQEKMWEGEPLSSTVIVIAVDNMEVRKRIVETQRANLIIDGRIGGENIRVLSVSLMDYESKKYYLDTWYPSGDASDLPCTARAIADVGFFVAAIICNRIRKFLKDGIITREVLFDANKLDIMKVEV